MGMVSFGKLYWEMKVGYVILILIKNFYICFFDLRLKIEFIEIILKFIIVLIK